MPDGGCGETGGGAGCGHAGGGGHCAPDGDGQAPVGCCDGVAAGAGAGAGAGEAHPAGAAGGA
ncbi:MAG: hypothetical protein U0Q15_11100 [Kineosporiaceae bacterium]